MQSMSIYVYIYVRHERRKKKDSLWMELLCFYLFLTLKTDLCHIPLFFYIFFLTFSLSFLYPLIILLNEAKEIVYKKKIKQNKTKKNSRWVDDRQQEDLLIEWISNKEWIYWILFYYGQSCLLPQIKYYPLYITTTPSTLFFFFFWPLLFLFL